MKAVLFDLDGVITDTAEYHFLAWQRLAKKIEIQIDRDFNEQLKGISRMDSLERILLFGERQNDFTSAEKAKLAAEKNQHYVEMLQQITPAQLLPGIKDLLENLKEQGYLLGLASASKNGPAILQQLGIADLFHVVVDPDSVLQGKPAPDIFSRGAELLQVGDTDCVGIEDAASGVAAIKAAEMVAIGVGDKGVLQAADFVVPDTSQLSIDLLKEVWQKNQEQ